VHRSCHVRPTWIESDITYSHCSVYATGWTVGSSNPGRSPAALPATYSKVVGFCCPQDKTGVELTTHFRLVLRLIMGGAIPLLPPIYDQGLDRNSCTLTHVASSYSFPVCSFGKTTLPRAISPHRMRFSPNPSVLAHNVPILALG